MTAGPWGLKSPGLQRCKGRRTLPRSCFESWGLERRHSVAVRLTRWTGAWQQGERGGPVETIIAVHCRGCYGKHSFLRRNCTRTMDERVLLYEGGQ